MRIGVDSNVLVAFVKKVGEPYHQSALELSCKDSDGEGKSVACITVRKSTFRL